jgi:hypothetical protein
MKSLLFLAVTVYATLAYAASIQQTKWHCTIAGDDEFVAFDLTQTGSVVSGTYEDKAGAWYPMDADNMSSHMTHDQSGYWNFSFGYAGEIGHQVNFALTRGNGMVDVTEWKSGQTPEHTFEKVTCY